MRILTRFPRKIASIAIAAAMAIAGVIAAPAANAQEIGGLSSQAPTLETAAQQFNTQINNSINQANAQFNGAINQANAQVNVAINQARAPVDGFVNQANTQYVNTVNQINNQINTTQCAKGAPVLGVGRTSTFRHLHQSQHHPMCQVFGRRCCGST